MFFSLFFLGKFINSLLKIAKKGKQYTNTSKGINILGGNYLIVISRFELSKILYEI